MLCNIMHHMCEYQNSSPITLPRIRQNVRAFGMYSPTFAATAAPSMLKCPDCRIREKAFITVTVHVAGMQITKDYETLSLKIDNPNFRKLFLCVTYKPPKGKIDQCLTYFQEILNNREISRREKWILGDFNVNLELRNEPNALLVNRFLKNNSLKQLITTHTRLTHKGGSCLDWTITDRLYIEQSGVLDKLLSDHFSIFAVRKKEKEKVCKKWKNIRINKNFDRDIFCTLLQYYDWTVYYASRDVDVLWNNLFFKYD